MFRRTTLAACAVAASASTTFDAAAMKNIAGPVTTKLPKMEGVPFGSVFAPYRLDIDWTREGGWESPVMMDFGPLEIPVQSGGLHYAMQCFEGCKAYYAAHDNSHRLFRPDMNAARMRNSMLRLGFPGFDEQQFVEVLKNFVRANKDFIPKKEGYTLYLRPGAIAMNENLQVAPADKIKLFFVASPVGPYYPNGFKPVRLICDRDKKRAWPGGSGNCKVGCNYAATIAHQVEHAKKGYQQVLWLGADEELNEVGAMNIMLLWKNANGVRELVTPALDGTILPGITRDSVLKVTRGWGEFKVTERKVMLTELEQALKEKRVEEVFGCGTAAIITAVDGLRIDAEEYPVPCPDNSIARRILSDLSDIQYGRKKHEWSVVL